uniref:Nuclear pore complex protein Nup155-like n=1 Tax=Hirondellea gigas TaxID=1518452 RepID=A0A2P2HZZ0_9CRUS
MLQSSLNSSVMAGMTVDAGGGDGRSVADASSVAGVQVEAAGRMLDKHINYDSCFPSLTDKLQIPAKGSCTVSGLSEQDYPGGTATGSAGAVLRHLHTLHKVPLPKELLHHFQHMQCNCMMGLFPEIQRAWLTIDSDIYVWLYKDGSDLAYFDGLHDTILSVGLMKPRAGVFKPYIEHLLCLTTPTEMVLLGVTFAPPMDNASSPSLTLLPEPLFSVSNDGGVFLMTVKGTMDGRLFMGAKDGDLWELSYQAEDGWFSRKCQKVNHSKSTLASFLPSFLTLAEEDSVVQIEVDESRHILYTLSEQGSISVFDLGADGTSTSRIAVMRHNTISAAAAAAAKTVDKANFKSIVSICPVDTSEAPAIHLVAVTGSGARLYLTCTSPTSASNTRPYQLQLVHVRLPPGFSANALTHRPTRVHKALYSHGCGVLCASESSESDVVWSVSCDQFPYHTALAESQAVVAVDGVIWAIADVTPSTMWGVKGEGRNAMGLRPPLVVNQQHQQPRQLIVLSAAGAHTLTSLRPVDQLQYLLQESGSADGAAVTEFFTAMSPTQACATALILATDPNLQNSQIAEWATQCLFRYGATPPVTLPNASATAHSIQSPAGYSFHPMQISTPVPNQAGLYNPGHVAYTPVGQAPQQQQGLNNTSFMNAQATLNTTSPHNNNNTEPQFSPLHNALYLYLARILRPVWSLPLLKEDKLDGNKILVSALSSGECSFLARQLELLARFMNTSPAPAPNSHIGLSIGIHSSNQLSGQQQSSSSSEESSSVAALCSLLQHTLQLLRLWTLLTHHNMPSILANLTKTSLEQLQGMSLRELVLAGREVCRNLIMTLLDKYHGDNASVSAISSQLREVCPELYRSEDAQLSKASQLILEAKATTDPARREAGFREAVALCKGVGGCVNVAGVGAQLASGGCYTGLVDLALSVAGQRDKEDRALHYYHAGQPHTDTMGYNAFNNRMECYRVVMDQLNQLVGSNSNTQSSSPSVPPRPGPPTSTPPAIPSDDASHYAHQIITLMSSSEDELAQVTLYQWLLDTGRSEQLLTLPSPSLEPFLRAPPKQQPMHQLLWRYYERNKDYYKAARTLALLADQPGSTSLSNRVEHLSRALMCLSSCEMNTATAFTDFLLHLEEKKDVARVQLMVLDGVTNAGGSSQDITALNSALLDITQLYENFAEPYQLWECKLAIVACAGHSEPQLVQSLWSHIIESELSSSERSPLASRLDALAAKLKMLARQYTNNPQYFPIDHIIRVCELKSVQLNVDNVGWLATGLLSCGVSITKLIQTYHTLYRSGESLWETERAPYHLLRVLCHLITTLMDNPPPTLQAPDRRVLREECLDRVASYLTDLDASAEPSAGLIAAHLRTCQLHLERNASY